MSAFTCAEGSTVQGAVDAAPPVSVDAPPFAGGVVPVSVVLADPPPPPVPVPGWGGGSPGQPRSDSESRSGRSERRRMGPSDEGGEDNPPCALPQGHVGRGREPPAQRRGVGRVLETERAVLSARS